MRGRLIRWTTMAAIALFAAWAGYRLSQESAPSSDEAADGALEHLITAPLTDLAGQPQTLGHSQAQLLVVNFWATWCPPCKQEMPAFDRIHQQLSGNGVQFVGIAIDDPTAVKEFALNHPVSFPQWLGDSRLLSLTADLGNRLQGLPFTIILDRQGHMVAAHLGRWSETDLSNRLETLLQTNIR